MQYILNLMRTFKMMMLMLLNEIWNSLETNSFPQHTSLGIHKAALSIFNRRRKPFKCSAVCGEEKLKTNFVFHQTPPNISSASKREKYESFTTPLNLFHGCLFLLEKLLPRFAPWHKCENVSKARIYALALNIWYVWTNVSESSVWMPQGLSAHSEASGCCYENDVTTWAWVDVL